MNRELAKKVADAILYEGYMLYPYRPSAIKNRQRWTVGILYPPGYSEVHSGTERSIMHSECLLETNDDTAVEIEVRFLHSVERQVEQLCKGRWQPVASLVVDERRFESWDEAVERSVRVGPISPEGAPRRIAFNVAVSCQTESLQDQTGVVVGRVRRIQREVKGTVSMWSGKIREGVLKLVMDVANQSLLPAGSLNRQSALPSALLSAHAVVMAHGGKFVSLLDPPADLLEAANSCRNLGNFPVLLGNQSEGERDMLLCSPILLYDYPQIAPESAGDFYDATEMDEMLTLRVMTLTDQEKSQMAMADEHVHTLLERTETSAREQLMRTHGTVRSLRPSGGT